MTFDVHRRPLGTATGDWYTWVTRASLIGGSALPLSNTIMGFGNSPVTRGRESSAGLLIAVAWQWRTLVRGIAALHLGIDHPQQMGEAAVEPP